MLPTLWFHNSWRFSGGKAAGSLFLDGDGIVVDHPRLSGYRLTPLGREGVRPQALFCDNETNVPRLFGAPAITATPRMGSTTMRHGREHGEPRPAWHQGVLVVPDHRSSRRKGELRLRLHRPIQASRRRMAYGTAATSTMSWRTGNGTRMSSMPR